MWLQGGQYAGCCRRRRLSAALRACIRCSLAAGAEAGIATLRHCCPTSLLTGLVGPARFHCCASGPSCAGNAGAGRVGCKSYDPGGGWPGPSDGGGVGGGGAGGAGHPWHSHTQRGRQERGADKAAGCGDAAARRAPDERPGVAAAQDAGYHWRRNGGSSDNCCLAGGSGRQAAVGRRSKAVRKAGKALVPVGVKLAGSELAG